MHGFGTARTGHCEPERTQRTAPDSEKAGRIPSFGLSGKLAWLTPGSQAWFLIGGTCHTHRKPESSCLVRKNWMPEAVIVSTARTPIGKAYRGALNATEGAILFAHAIQAAVSRAGLDPAEVEDVTMGAALQQGATFGNIAR